MRDLKFFVKLELRLVYISSTKYVVVYYSDDSSITITLRSYYEKRII